MVRNRYVHDLLSVNIAQSTAQRETRRFLLGAEIANVICLSQWEHYLGKHL